MKWLLQVGQFLFGRHDTTDLARVDVRIGRAYHDLDGWIQLADASGGPDAVFPRRHSHIQEDDRERLILGECLLYCDDGRIGLITEHRIESCAARRCRAW